jgi:hypothetical protein
MLRGVRTALPIVIWCVLAAVVGAVSFLTVSLVWPTVQLDLVLTALGISLGMAALAWYRLPSLRSWRLVVMPLVALSALLGYAVLGFGAHCYIRTSLQGYELCK